MSNRTFPSHLHLNFPFRKLRATPDIKRLVAGVSFGKMRSNKLRWTVLLYSNGGVTSSCVGRTYSFLMPNTINILKFKQRSVEREQEMEKFYWIKSCMEWKKLLKLLRVHVPSVKVWTEGCIPIHSPASHLPKDQRHSTTDGWTG